jgi:hypothetical protein
MLCLQNLPQKKVFTMLKNIGYNSSWILKNIYTHEIHSKSYYMFP